MTSLRRLLDSRLRRSAASPTPNEINWNADYNDAYSLQRFVRVFSQVVDKCIGNQYCRGNDKKKRCPGITRNTIGTARFWNPPAINEDSAGGETIKNPSAKNHIGQQLIEVPCQRKYCSPDRPGDDRKCRSPESRVNYGQFLEEHPIICHRIVNSRTSKQVAVCGAENRYKNSNCNQSRRKRMDDCDQRFRGHAFGIGNPAGS